MIVLQVTKSLQFHWRELSLSQLRTIFKSGNSPSLPTFWSWTRLSKIIAGCYWHAVSWRAYKSDGVYTVYSTESGGLRPSRFLCILNGLLNLTYKIISGSWNHDGFFFRSINLLISMQECGYQRTGKQSFLNWFIPGNGSSKTWDVLITTMGAIAASAYYLPCPNILFTSVTPQQAAQESKLYLTFDFSL